MYIHESECNGIEMIKKKQVVIVVNLCCVEGLMEDRCISNKHSR